MRSSRNKTIDLSLEEGREYLDRCVRVETPAAEADILDRTIWGDCLHVMPLLPEGFADLVIADPPYNMNKNFGGSSFSRLNREDYLAYTRRWLALVRPLMRPGASIYVCCDWRCSAAIETALGELFTVRSRITWQREKGRGAARNWKNTMEDIWFATLGDGYTFNLDAVKVRRRVIAPYRADGVARDWEETAEGRFRDTCPGNFWDDVTVPYWSMPENTAHPTQKPEKLLAKLVLASSNAGDTVFDPFLGSGSTSVTAKKLGRRFVGIEREPQYCLWAEKRLETAETDKSIQGFDGKVFRERNSK
ncbi:MAG: DNA-methyltransferase [Oscillospiraceae bacterium]